MRNITLLTFLILIVFHQSKVSAQSDFIEPISKVSFLAENTRANLYYSQVNNFRHLEVTPIRMNNLWDFQTMGELMFNLPGIEKPIRAVVNMPKRFSETEYSWTGDILDETNRIIGYVNFVQKRGKKFGSIEIENRRFVIKDLNTIYEDDQVLIELDQEVLTKKCIDDEFTEGLEHEQEPIFDIPVLFGGGGGGGEDDCEAVITILVLYTQEVIDAGHDPEQMAELGVLDLNTALSESNIPNINVSAELVGVSIWNDYVENSDGVEAVNNLADDIAVHPHLRDSLNADLVVLFQEEDMFVINPLNGEVIDLAGIAIDVNEIESATDTLDYNSAFSVIEATAGSQTFVHEVGHLLGCRHLKGNNPHPYANARIFCSSPSVIQGQTICNTGAIKSTIMNGDSDSIQFAPRVLRFSNPDGYYNGEITGSDVHNNALAISLSACQVSLFGGKVEGAFEDPPFNAFASGPTNVSNESGVEYLYSSYYWGCLDGGVNYCWDISWDYGANYQHLSLEEDAVLYSDEIDPDVLYAYIRLTAFCTEEPDTSISFIEVKNWGAYNLEIAPSGPTEYAEQATDFIESEDVKNQENYKPAFENSDELVYPNPAKDRLYLNMDKQAITSLDVSLLSAQGVSYKLNSFGESYDISTIPPGFYIAALKGKDKSHYSPIIIVR
jgi:hypothetical protein